MSTTTTGRVVFTGTADWFRIVADNGEIVTGDAWIGANCDRAALVAELDTEDAESWVAPVTEVDARHTAIQVGDYACCQGIGADVVFVRLTN